MLDLDRWADYSRTRSRYSQRARREHRKHIHDHGDAQWRLHGQRGPDRSPGIKPCRRRRFAHLQLRRDVSGEHYRRRGERHPDHLHYRSHNGGAEPAWLEARISWQAVALAWRWYCFSEFPAQASLDRRSQSNCASACRRSHFQLRRRRLTWRRRHWQRGNNDRELHRDRDRRLWID